MATRKAKNTLPPLYTATIRLFGKTYRGEGSSVLEALRSLNPPAAMKTVSVLTVSKGNVSKDRVLPPNATVRLFSPSRLMRDVALKNTSLLFDL